MSEHILRRTLIAIGYGAMIAASITLWLGA